MHFICEQAIKSGEPVRYIENTLQVLHGLVVSGDHWKPPVFLFEKDRQKVIEEIQELRKSFL